MGDSLCEDTNPRLVARPIKEVVLAPVETTDETAKCRKNSFVKRKMSVPSFSEPEASHEKVFPMSGKKISKSKVKPKKKRIF